jgi:hypothetical protein
MIHASDSDLRQAFHKHYSAVQETKEGCSYLLLFYAVECGLKSILLRRKRMTSTAQIQDSALLSHDFAPLIKELRLPHSVVGDIGYTGEQSQPKLPNFRLHRDNSSWEMREAHQAWRYGIRVNSQDQKILIEWLEKVCIWIKENSNR